MSCVITYKGQKYSEEQFKEYFINNKQEFATSIAKNKDVIDSFKRKMEGIDFVFSQSPELASIGSKAQYLQYLSTIFKTSKVKDIVYHGSKNTFEQFSKDFLGSNLGQISPDSKLGFFFSNLENAKGFGKNIFTTILNMSNPKIVTEDEYTKLSGGTREFKNKVFSKLLNESKQENKDSLLADFRVSDYMGSKQYVVFEPEQIHVMGGKNDIQGFKDFVDNKNIEELPGLDELPEPQCK